MFVFEVVWSMIVESVQRVLTRQRVRVTAPAQESE